MLFVVRILADLVNAILRSRMRENLTYGSVGVVIVGQLLNKQLIGEIL
jgi:hypothetical protein